MVKFQMKTISYIFLFLLLIGCTSGESGKKEDLTKQAIATSYVMDEEGVWSKAERDVLLEKINLLHQKSSKCYLAVLTTSSYEPFDNIKDFSTHKANEIGLGTKEDNNGVFIVLSRSRGAIWIAVGVGLEHILSNEVCSKIINEMLPNFKQANFLEGIEKGIDEIDSRLNSSASV